MGVDHKNSTETLVSTKTDGCWWGLDHSSTCIEHLLLPSAVPHARLSATHSALLLLRLREKTGKQLTYVLRIIPVPPIDRLAHGILVTSKTIQRVGQSIHAIHHYSCSWNETKPTTCQSWSSKPHPENDFTTSRVSLPIPFMCVIFPRHWKRKPLNLYQPVVGRTAGLVWHIPSCT